METYTERLAKFVEYTGLKPSNIEDECKLGRSTIITALKGESKLGNKTLGKLLQRWPEFNTHWLQTGQGNMIAKNDPEVKLKALEKSYRELSEKYTALLEEHLQLLKKR